VEIWQESHGNEEKTKYKQRMKWWESGTPEPIEWISLADTDMIVPSGKYGIGLLVFNCQADFGKVTVTPIDKSPNTSKRDRNL
jgi:hypothetical protein